MPVASLLLLRERPLILFFALEADDPPALRAGKPVVQRFTGFDSRSARGLDRHSHYVAASLLRMTIQRAREGDQDGIVRCVRSVCEIASRWQQLPLRLGQCASPEDEQRMRLHSVAQVPDPSPARYPEGASL